MIKRINKYLEYRRNKKTAKRELAKMAAAALPVISEFAGKRNETIKFVNKLVTETKNIDGEKLVAMVLDTAAEKLASDQTRLIEILQYAVSLSPEDIRKILVHSMVETMPDAGNIE